MATRKTITLHEVRRALPLGSKGMGQHKLRTKKRAIKLCRFLNARYGVGAVTHAWKISPSPAEWARLERMGA